MSMSPILTYNHVLERNFLIHSYFRVPISAVSHHVNHSQLCHLLALCYQMVQAVWWHQQIISTTGSLQAGTEQERHTEGWPLSPGTPKDSLWQACGRSDCVCAGGRPSFYATVSQSVNQRASRPAGRVQTG